MAPRRVPSAPRPAAWRRGCGGRCAGGGGRPGCRGATELPVPQIRRCRLIGVRQLCGSSTSSFRTATGSAARSARVSRRHRVAGLADTRLPRDRSPATLWLLDGFLPHRNLQRGAQVAGSGVLAVAFSLDAFLPHRDPGTKPGGLVSSRCPSRSACGRGRGSTRAPRARCGSPSELHSRRHPLTTDPGRPPRSP